MWDDLDNKWITSSQAYGSYGNLISKTDPRGKVTQFYYDDATHAVPNRVVVDPQNGTGTQTATTVFDYYTGLVTSQTDANNNISTIDYTNHLLGTMDPFGRPGITLGPTVASQRHHVTTTYVDSARQVIQASDLNTENDKLLKTKTTSDMLGRVIKTEQTEDGTNYSISALKVYEQMGKITYSSNPTRGPGASTHGWTRAMSDNAGRIVEVATFAGDAQPSASPAPDIPGYSGRVSTTYDAEFTTVTDQAGKVRRSKVDALGRLVRVDEPTTGNALGTTSSPNQATNYTYSVLGNLLTVSQGTQTRSFTYDSLSRLRTALNPESGTVTYTYDDNGNLLTKTDSRVPAVTTTYAYDALNRATTRSYSDGTPTVTYAYDSGAVANGKGRLASVSSSVSSYSYGGYDARGQVLSGLQTIGARTYPVSSTYDLAGHVKSTTYPSGRIVNYSYDNAGRLSSFAGNLGDGTTRNYATGIVYDSNGAWTREQFGTTTPLYNKRYYNSRQQLYGMFVSTVNDDFNWNEV